MRRRILRLSTAGLVLLPTLACTAQGPTAAPPRGSSSGSTGSASTDAAATATERGCARAVAARMSPTEKAGQVLMVGVPATDPASGAATVRRYRLGGVFLHHATTQSPSRLRSRLQVLQAATGTPGVGLHVAVDQEGGRVLNLRGAGFPRLPSALVQGRWDDATLAAAVGRAARTLHEAGVTVNLAPVADTVEADAAADNPPIGALGREYGSTPEQVARAVTVVVGATQEQSVLAALKHFPGLGRVTANTDFSTRAVDPVTTVADPFLAPFQAGIEAGTAFVMVSSARYPKLDPASVAAFSRPVVTDLLRTSLHFDGVIISDDLGQARAVQAVPAGQRAVRFLDAGGDLVLTVRLADAAPMSAALLARAKADGAFRQRLDDAVVNVLASKVRLGLVRCDS